MVCQMLLWLITSICQNNRCSKHYSPLQLYFPNRNILLEVQCDSLHQNILATEAWTLKVLFLVKLIENAGNSELLHIFLCILYVYQTAGKLTIETTASSLFSVSYHRQSMYWSLYTHWSAHHDSHFLIWPSWFIPSRFTYPHHLFTP